MRSKRRRLISPIRALSVKNVIDEFIELTSKPLCYCVSLSFPRKTDNVMITSAKSRQHGDSQQGTICGTERRPPPRPPPPSFYDGRIRENISSVRSLRSIVTVLSMVTARHSQRHLCLACLKTGASLPEKRMKYTLNWRVRVCGRCFNARLRRHTSYALSGSKKKKPRVWFTRGKIEILRERDKSVVVKVS